MTFAIEKGVAIPEHRNKKTEYPFKSMEIGDSFFVQETEKKRATIAGYVSKVNQEFKGMQHFIVRKVEGGTRVWRDK